MSDLTLILVLKDREAFTQRWLDYHARFNPQLNVIIADGSQNRFVTESLIEKLPKNIRYFYDGPDSDIHTMTRKIQKALSMVETDYTILASNDDFYILSGLNEAVNFLRKNGEWQASAGVVRDFSIVSSSKVLNDAYGNVRFGDALYKSASISESSSMDRISQFLLVDESFWHAVYRTKTLHEIYCEAVKMQINDLVLYELFINLMSAQVGKLHRNHRSLFMLHQVHSQTEAYNLKRLDERDQDWKVQLNLLLKSFFQSNNSNAVALTYEDILIIRQRKADQTSHSRLRPVLESLKYKYAHSMFISVVNRMDPFTFGVYRNKEVKNILRFLKHSG